jgi:hypothetical protein
MTDASELQRILNDQSTSRDLKLQEICKTMFNEIPSANLISLWVFDESITQIECIKAYDVEADKFSDGHTLKKADFPKYFDSILENEVISASDARKHPATIGFTEVYFEPNDIHSLLDFILHNDFKPKGVICCESKGKQVVWNANNLESIRMIATMVSFMFDI